MGVVTAEHIELVENGDEPRPETSLDILRGWQERWKAALSAYLPFLTNVLEEALDHVTSNIIKRIKAQLPQLPDYFGDESTRSKLRDALGRREAVIENVVLFKEAWEGSEIVGLKVIHGESHRGQSHEPSSATEERGGTCGARNKPFSYGPGGERDHGRLARYSHHD